MMQQPSLKLCRITSSSSSSRTLCWLSTRAITTTATTSSTSTSIQNEPSNNSFHQQCPCFCSPCANSTYTSFQSSLASYDVPSKISSSLSPSLYQLRMYSTTNKSLNKSNGTNSNNGINRDGGGGGETSSTSSTEKSTTSETMETTPLSELSSQDLQLTLDSIQTQSQQQQQKSSSSSSTTTTSSSSSPTLNLNLNDIPGTSTGVKPSSNRQLAILYTCNVCNTRSAKKFTERAYNHGVVLVRCPNCESLHLIADRLGYFSDDDELHDGDSSDGSDGSDGSSKKKKGWDIEMFMKKIGQEDNIKVVTNGDEEDVLEVTLDDVIGKSSGGIDSTTTTTTTTK